VSDGKCLKGMDAEGEVIPFALGLLLRKGISGERTPNLGRGLKKKGGGGKLLQPIGFIF